MTAYDDRAESLAAGDHEDREAVEAKIEGGEVKHTVQAKKSSGEVVDLLAALQRSVDAAKSIAGACHRCDGKPGHDDAHYNSDAEAIRGERHE